MIFRGITEFTIAIRILSAIIVGGVFGLERSMKNRPAGLRTYMLVCVGSCLIMLTNQYIFLLTGVGDPMRLGAQVVSGIGFLGAGTIIVTKHNQIKGLTTAAGLWAAAAVGLALGVGFYEGAIISAVGIYIILTVLQRLESKLQRKRRLIDLYIELDKSVKLGALVHTIRGLELEIKDIQYEPDGAQGEETRAYIVTLKSKKPQDHIVLVEKIKNLAGIAYMEEL